MDQQAIEFVCGADCYPDSFVWIGLILASSVASLLSAKWRMLPLAAAITVFPLQLLDILYRSWIWGGSLRAGLTGFARSEQHWLSLLIFYAIVLLMASAFFGLKRLVIYCLPQNGQ